MYTATVAVALFAILFFATVAAHRGSAARRRRAARRKDQFKTEIYLRRAERSVRRQKP